VKDPPVDLRPPLQTTARPVPQLPDEHHSGSLTFEPKLDGWRCLTFHRLNGRVALQSRQQKPPALSGVAASGWRATRP
jgi:ATP-dependent DNA ligase